jgi:hypothetical protein
MPEPTSNASLVMILTLVLVSGLVGLGYRNLQNIRERS